MTDAEQNERLEIYKLHAELADRVSQRREGANRLYVSLLVGLVVFLGALLRFGIGDIPEQYVLRAIGLFGVLLSVSWFVTLLPYRQLNSEKFRVLQELEKDLAFPFFTKEWDPGSKGDKSNRYWRQTKVEVTLPVLFGLLFLAIAAYSFFFEPASSVPQP